MATTIFDNLGKVIRGKDSVSPDIVRTPIYGTTTDRILFSTNNKDEYERKLAQYRQQKLVSYQWVKAGADATINNFNNYSAVRLMYRDADLMDGPEIGAALDVIKDEACCLTSEGKMLTINSKSARIKSILEDLFVNRLNIHVDLPMICRDMVKYGNEFMLLNVDMHEGVLGWRKLDVYTMNRVENGFDGIYGGGVINQVNDLKPDTTYFVREGYNESNPYQDWQVAHFRLLNDSFFLPYGCSHLHKARRAWRMWSMMEDSMLVYRLDKSIERRVFKIYVGAIDEQDVHAYVEDIANNFKRTQMVDPETGQLDLRKNFLDVSSDYFIPVRDESAPNPIETLQGAQNQTQMDDIDYMQNKIFAALRVPKTFLNFQDAQGKGQNLSFSDTRFCRMINSVQQFLLMELNKIAMTHLCIMGFKDDIGNFSLSLNNPSSLIESQELDDLTKRISTLSTALADPGNGIPMMSLHWGLKKIMKMTDTEIKDMLMEIRLEKAMAAELATTQTIIKKTGIFDAVDNIYGDYDAMNAQTQPSQAADPNAMGGGGAMGGGMPAPAMGDDDFSDLGAPGGDEDGDIGGDEGETDMADAPEADSGGLNEGKKVIKENVKTATQKYFEMLTKKQKDNGEINESIADFEGKNVYIDEKMKSLFETIDNLLDSKDTILESKDLRDII